MAGSLVAAGNGTVDSDAEAAFAEAVRLNPHDVPARFYLGLKRMPGHGDRPGALALWQRAAGRSARQCPAASDVLIDRMAAC